jgi:transcriptional regulator with XRE-family HTH domain
MADRLGVTVTTISNWEIGSTVPQLTEAKRIAAAFGTSQEEIEQAIVKASRLVAAK